MGSLRQFDNKYLLASLWLAVTASALAVVWTTHETRGQTSQLLSMRSQANALMVEHGQLLLQERTLTSAAGVERLATGQLGLRFPSDQDIGVLLP